VVQAGHGGELTRFEVRGIVVGNERIGIGRVTDDDHAHITDPLYFNGPDMKSTDLRRLPDDDGWAPTACSVR
jgi:hypothetical protein